MECIEKIAAQYDFRTARTRQLLTGFESRFERIECDKVRKQIQQTQTEIEKYNTEIGRLLNRKNDFIIRLFGLEFKVAQTGEDSEILEYFLRNNRLYLQEVTNTDMHFSVGDYLEYFNEEIAERSIANNTSYVYNDGNGRRYTSISSEHMKKLMRAIFLDKTLRVKMCAAYMFNLNGNVSPLRDHAFPSEFNTFMQNPHIDSLGCMGDYTKNINTLLSNNNYILALEECIASCKSLNFGDSAAMQRFMKAMYGGETRLNNRCIELPDGSVVKPVKAIEWLEQQEAQNNAETTQTEEA
jgi:hypothetical protein